MRRSPGTATTRYLPSYFLAGSSADAGVVARQPSSRTQPVRAPPMSPLLLSSFGKLGNLPPRTVRQPSAIPPGRADVGLRGLQDLARPVVLDQGDHAQVLQRGRLVQHPGRRDPV